MDPISEAFGRGNICKCLAEREVEDWTIAERPAPGTANPLQLHAMNHASGSQMSLIATDHFEVVWVLQPASR